MWSVCPEGVQCMWACTQLVRSLCSKGRYSPGEKIGTEANPGKSWFISYSLSGMVKSIIALFIMFNFSLHLFHLLPESCVQLNLCHIYANHRSSALPLIPLVTCEFFMHCLWLGAQCSSQIILPWRRGALPISGPAVSPASAQYLAQLFWAAPLQTIMWLSRSSTTHSQCWDPSCWGTQLIEPGVEIKPAWAGTTLNATESPKLIIIQRHLIYLRA